MRKNMFLQRGIITLLAFFVLSSCVAVYAAPVLNEKQIVKQPNGEELTCFLSGDEFFRHLHSEEGWLITQNEDGWYVYAKLDENGKLVPSETVATNDDTPSALSLGLITAEDIDFDLNPDLVWMPEDDDIEIPAWDSAYGYVGAKRDKPFEGKIENIIIPIAFADQSDTLSDTLKNRINGAFNDNNPSLKHYMHTVSDGLVDIHSTLVGLNNAAVFMYKDKHPRSYYMRSSYRDDAVRKQREHAMLRNAIQSVNRSILLSGKKLDTLVPGTVDSITFIVSGDEVRTGGEMLWPHKWAFDKNYVKLNGLNVREYSFLVENHMFRADGTDNVSVIAHEQLHVASFPDNYRYRVSSRAVGRPVGGWDVMAETDDNKPQLPNTHALLRYGGWGYGLAELTENGRYAISPVGSQTGITAYAIKTDVEKEFILIECKNGTNDSGYDKLFGTAPNPLDYNPGLTITRINLDFSGNANRDGGKRDECYTYRPNEEERNGGWGDIENASFSADAGRLTFGGGDDFKNQMYLFGVNNTTDYEISNVSAIGTDGTMTFDIKIKPDTPSINVAYISDVKGKIDADYNGEVFESGGIVTDGNVKFKATPLPGYMVERWFVNGIAQPTSDREFILPIVPFMERSTTVAVTYRKADSSVAVDAPVIKTNPSDLSMISAADTVEVTIESDYPEIYYTLNGKTPTPDSEVYDGTPIEVTAGTLRQATKIITAYAVHEDGIASEMVSQDIVFRDATGIDYFGIETVLVPRIPPNPDDPDSPDDPDNPAASGFYIDLQDEKLVVPYGYVPTAYSVDGGKKWKKVSVDIDNEKNPLNAANFHKLLNKDLSLYLYDKEFSGKIPPEDAELMKFENINKRPKVTKLKIDYAIAADKTGFTTGEWVLSPDKTNAHKGGQIGRAVILSNGKPGKVVDEQGWGQFSPRGGVLVEKLGESETKAKKTTYFYRDAPKRNVAPDGTVSFMAASKLKKYSALSEQPKPKYSKKGNEIKLKKGAYIYAGSLVDASLPATDFIATKTTSTEFEEGKLYYLPAKATIPAISGVTHTVWNEAGKKPVTQRLEITD
ncbi:MAG: chitobiase/beta-hexosaminidase C-terminal domain-containing protein [Oscillospiraceae bacterium]|nr:chitobiase/beta-hexosaminidase C-terminal domain-containing protein [Oscillospiraceae bacterium]